MSHPKHIQNYFDSLAPLFQVVDEVLNDYTGDKCYQLPLLLMNVSAKMNWDAEGKQLRAKDPIIRHYIKNHPDWDITRGAHGGVVRRAENEKKKAAIKAKLEAIEAAKKDISAALDAEIAKNNVATSAPDVDEDNTDVSE